MTREQLEQQLHRPPDTFRQGSPIQESGQRGYTNLAGADFGLSDPKKAGLTERITLASILQKPVWGLLTGMVLSALIIYGFSGIIYFTGLLVITKDTALAGLYRFLVVLNVMQGITIFLMVWLVSDWLDRQIRSVWWRHLLISGMALALSFVVNVGIYLWLGEGPLKVLAQRPNYDQSNAPGWAYVLAYIVVANLFSYVLRQGRQLTRKMTEQEIQLLSLDKLKTRAELDALQAKINPHFLYNALNSVASLVHDNPEKAEEMTLLLSKLFRYSTGRDGELFASLADELEMVKTYLQVEQVRFGNRLTFSVDVSDPGLIELRLPQFLLQPIVENAIKHGIAKRADAGRIDVRIYEKNGELHLCVHDNGPAFSDEMGGGYGLRSIQDKLKLLYGDDARMELQNWPVKQVLLSIKLEKISEPSTNYLN
ncbi:sensor histidine kinase [Spirosoma montaniterrae]|uniref:Histidine kinase n=1 Tax=Spirosoma montaniterrae TaxID=1178516 RepID=A0A1P9WS06_9BACT|nr:histidine kinase [Spirosoma montaniterrae]AQG78149.1 histidine kinase [Spirosoma montaniterrae]